VNRHDHPDGIAIVLHEDLLNPWCWIAERRVRTALDDLDGLFGPLKYAPFPLRFEPRLPSSNERKALAREIRKAAAQTEGKGFTPDLWLSPDPPTSSFPSLLALAAARLQGAARESALREALREAALRRGLNVARPDVVIELAARNGLDLARFTAALSAPATERTVREAYEQALDRGIDDVPSLVIGDEWLVTGLRKVDEYRTILKRYLASQPGAGHGPTLH
jgi:predicted DsbA family dithiol-disulfide isomerase